MQKLEIVKCIISDEGLEVEILNDYCVRAKTKTNKYMFDIWAPHNKKSGNFLGYTILKWSDKQYYRKVFEIEKFIIKNK